MIDREDIRYYDQATIRLACLRSKKVFDLGHVVNGCDEGLHAAGRGRGLIGIQITFDKCRRWRVEQ